MAWSSLTHHFYGLWKNEALRGRRILVLWSGGADSTALVALLHELQKPLGYELIAGHLHHGPSVCLSARNQAEELCTEQAQRWGLPLLRERSSVILKNEEEMRDFRRAAALRWSEQHGVDRIALAHHADDLLETRFFRLLRGTSAQGLTAMREWEAPWWRPFLPISRSEILAYLEWNRLAFHEDPTNAELSYRRNWIRHEVFPLLEKGMPGSLRNLSQSLQRIIDETSVPHKTFDLEDFEPQNQDWTSPPIPRPWFQTLSAIQQKSTLARYLWQLGVRGFRHTQIEEVMKRLDKSQIVHNFSVAGCEWCVNAERIEATRTEPRSSADPGLEGCVSEKKSYT